MTAPIVDTRNAAVRYSVLKLMDRSPAHCYAGFQRGIVDETLSMRIGSGAHALLFGSPRVVVYRGGTLMIDKVVKGKKGAPDTVVQVPKEYSDVRNGACWEKFKEEHADCLILNETEMKRAEAMARALDSDPVASSLLFVPGTQHEHRLEWTFMGRRCSGTLDALGPTAIIDLKCVKESSPRRFPYQARSMHWHGQVAWYRNAAALAGLGEREPLLCAIESTDPYPVQIFRLTDDDILEGERLYTSWMQRLLECEESGYWPSYADGIVPLNVRNLPPAPVEDDDDELDASGDDIAA